MQSWFTGDIDHAWIYKSQLQASIDFITANAEAYYSSIESGNLEEANTLYSEIICYLKLLQVMELLSSVGYEAFKRDIELPEDKKELRALFLTKRKYGLFVRRNLESVLYDWLFTTGMKTKNS